ncbi:MAG TPA: type II toxin-antitoxin system death-on-curing family toxin [Gemmatimonadaceae bacterium]|nr:type II toxin-antitoxin system death-on-curing family toxin [Gemmatimonadaceae bacterium]
MDEPIWVDAVIVDAVHTSQLHEHGGLQGMRAATALAAALARPQQKYVYDPNADIAQLAAAYAFGIAMSHPYSDANKRTAFLVAAIFLELNGYDLGRADDDVVETMRAVADKRMTEIELASWIRGGLTTL